MQIASNKLSAVVMVAIVAMLGCSSGQSPVASTAVDDTDSSGGGTGGTTTTSVLPSMYAHFSSGVVAYLDGEQVVIETDDIPNHPSPYFGAGNSGYEAPHSGMVVNPNRIAAQDFQFRIPASPAVASRASDTNLGAIGVAVNGVALFNQYAGPNNAALDNEIDTFDRYNGHPQQSGQYHYHFEPVYLTAADKSALVGVLLDGFPVYGPEELGGSAPSGLDDCNGHVGVTPDHPAGIYHYHTTELFPYISGCYRGTAGSVTD